MIPAAMEIRLRCLEAARSGGVQDPQRLVSNAIILEKYVLSAVEVTQADDKAASKKTAAKT